MQKTCTYAHLLEEGALYGVCVFVRVFFYFSLIARMRMRKR